jgi:hypothetical protein
VVIKDSKIVRRFKCGYNVHEEVWDDHVNGPVNMRVAYTPKGEFIGSIEDANILCKKLGIKPQKINKNYQCCNIGFSERYQKWYGWSYHRVITEFGVGSKITKDSCGYRASTPEGLYEQYTRIGENGCRRFDLDDVKITKTGIRVTTYSANTKPTHHYITCGKGEWEAKTLADAKVMAIAYAKSII